VRAWDPRRHRSSMRCSAARRPGRRVETTRLPEVACTSSRGSTSRRRPTTPWRITEQTVITRAGPVRARATLRVAPSSGTSPRPRPCCPPRSCWQACLRPRRRPGAVRALEVRSELAWVEARLSSVLEAELDRQSASVRWSSGSDSPGHPVCRFWALGGSVLGRRLVRQARGRTSGCRTEGRLLEFVVSR